MSAADKYFLNHIQTFSNLIPKPQFQGLMAKTKGLRLSWCDITGSEEQEQK